MLALRRASNPLRNVGYTLGISHACCSKFETPKSLESHTGILKSPQAVPGGCLSVERFYHSNDFKSKLSLRRRGLSSQTGKESIGEEDNLQGAVSDLELPADDALSSAELLDDGAIEDPSELGLLNHETNTSDKKSSRIEMNSELVEVILADIHSPARSALDKWIADGKELGWEEISLVIHNLRKRRLYGKALQVLEWVEANKQLDFVEENYASSLDLVAKVRGLQKAEDYFQNVPESFRGEVLYRTLLAACVTYNAMKAEEVFNKMRELGFPLTSFVCNQLLILYKRYNRKKAANVLSLMEKEKVKPTSVTYSILIDIKGQANDITGMNEIVETMKAEGIEPLPRSQAVLARHYIRGGLKEKAEAILKQMEGGNLEDHRSVCHLLLPLYAALEKADEVERVWKVCKSNPSHWECTAAIEAWGKLKKIKEAEAVLNKMPKTSKPQSLKIYSALLKVYGDNEMFDKGKDLVKQMTLDGFGTDPLIWDALVKFHVKAGEVEKAGSLLRRASRNSMKKPYVTSYMAIMDGYANKGDVHNTEFYFYSIKRDGCRPQIWQFQTLVRAYTNAKAPCYGMRERMKAENVFPNRSLALEMAKIDAFRKTGVFGVLV